MFYSSYEILEMSKGRSKRLNDEIHRIDKSKTHTINFKQRLKVNSIISLMVEFKFGSFFR